MSEQDKLFLSYLAAWAVDRIITNALNCRDPESYGDVGLLSEAELMDQAKVNLMNFGRLTESK